VFGGGHIWELALVLILALVFFGPRRLPEIGGALGKGIREFRRGTQDHEDDTSLTDTPAPRVQGTSSAQDGPASVPLNRETKDREAS
jgi:sec-independent protein translocase protein TatA